MVSANRAAYRQTADWDTYRNHSIGFVFQSYNLIPHQSVLANVELALTLSGVSGEERRARAVEALEKVGLVQLQLDIIRQRRILLDAHDHHGAIAVLGQIDGLACSQHGFLDFREFVSQIGNRSNIYHSNSSMIPFRFYHYIIRTLS